VICISDLSQIFTENEERKAAEFALSGVPAKLDDEGLPGLGAYKATLGCILKVALSRIRSKQGSFISIRDSSDLTELENYCQTHKIMDRLIEAGEIVQLGTLESPREPYYQRTEK
jgi:hypothetical protein